MSGNKTLVCLSFVSVIETYYIFSNMCKDIYKITF